MTEIEEFHPCLIAGTAPHSQHIWYPLVEDPEDPQVLHLALAPLVCKGTTVEEWMNNLEARRG